MKFVRGPGENSPGIRSKNGRNHQGMAAGMHFVQSAKAAVGSQEVCQPPTGSRAVSPSRPPASCSFARQPCSGCERTLSFDGTFRGPDRERRAVPEATAWPLCCCSAHSGEDKEQAEPLSVRQSGDSTGAQKNRPIPVCLADDGFIVPTVTSSGLFDTSVSQCCHHPAANSVLSGASCLCSADSPVLSSDRTGQPAEPAP